ncbi:hypothetical protein GH714_020441 [Hevea brasiliensis]|uniref:Uncharacterized protein n=1 Tax=Hevea brasiliensis TaxID=3981 RepID=A0A6A6KQ76_HEVBR|nr:hypothetical protein GH714_020441 [Hevea brasiliensis]
MWAKFRKIRKDGKELVDACESLNVDEEYVSALRTQSYTDFFAKAQSLVNKSSFPSFCHQKFSEVLLEPGQEAIPAILESAIFSKIPELKGLMLNYFDLSAEASRTCSHLLKNINQIQSNYQYIQQVLDSTINDHSPDKVKLIASELNSFINRRNPFSTPNKNDFKLIHDRKVAQQLDMAAKGTYILNRAFDTMSRLVARLHDEVEDNKAMIQFCLESREDKFSLQVVKELHKSDIGIRKQVEELEEHVYLCLLTINRARGLVIKEMTTSAGIESLREHV